MPLDVYDRQMRSQVMRKVRSKDTKPELKVRRALHRMGLRFRLHRKDLPGSPDIVFPRHRVALFVNGCFWHGHRDCKRSKLPSTRREFWRNKISANVNRDARNKAALEKLGWRVFVVWECEIKTDEEVASLATDIAEQLSQTGEGTS